MPQSVHGDVTAPGQQGIDDDEPGDEWRRLQPRTEAARRRRPTEPGVEDDDATSPSQKIGIETPTRETTRAT